MQQSFEKSKETEELLETNSSPLKDEMHMESIFP
jgi:hypothetical protein